MKDATIMIVDDDEATVDVLHRFLEEEGYRHFVETSDSTRALEILASERPDVVLLDLKMPKVNGYEILTRISADDRLKHTPVIVLSSSTDASAKFRVLEMGASEFLAKPVDPSELALRLRNTLAGKAYQDRLVHLDPLTGLPNRRTFLERVDWALRSAKRYGRICAVLEIDLDRFGQINSTLGPAVGDALLKEVARRLEDSIRESGTVARLVDYHPHATLSRIGGDEFAVLLPETALVENAAGLARRMLALMEKPIQAQGHELFLTPSIGIAVYPEDGAEVNTLLKHVDIAMSHAKRSGGNTYEFFSKKLNIRSMERLTLESRLRKALDRDELQLYYQPKVDTRTGKVVGAEALLRWNIPDLGTVSPTKFMPIAEETDLILPIGEWVLHAACKQNKAWQGSGLQPLRVAVNVSSQQFRNRRLLASIIRALNSSGLEPGYLALELTESVIMENAKENIEALNHVNEMGLELAVDDFGTGYSSLSYLKRFPLDELKIDRSFVRGVHADVDNAAIVTAIVVMAHSLGLRVVAEGVETERDLDLLVHQGCEEYQGDLFSKPIPADEFAALLSAGASNE